MSQGCRGIPRLSMGPRGRHPARDAHARSLPTSGPHSETHVAPLYRLLACSRAVLVPSASIRIPSSCIASCQTLHSFFPRESASLLSSRLIPAAPGCCQRGMPHHSLQAITTLEPVLVNIFLELSSRAASCSHTSRGRRRCQVPAVAYRAVHARTRLQHPQLARICILRGCQRYHLYPRGTQTLFWDGHRIEPPLLPLLAATAKHTAEGAPTSCSRLCPTIACMHCRLRFDGGGDAWQFKHIVGVQLPSAPPVVDARKILPCRRLEPADSPGWHSNRMLETDAQFCASQRLSEHCSLQQRPWRRAGSSACCWPLSWAA